MYVENLITNTEYEIGFSFSIFEEFNLNDNIKKYCGRSNKLINITDFIQDETIEVKIKYARLFNNIGFPVNVIIFTSTDSYEYVNVKMERDVSFGNLLKHIPCYIQEVEEGYCLDNDENFDFDVYSTNNSQIVIYVTRPYFNYDYLCFTLDE